MAWFGDNFSVKWFGFWTESQNDRPKVGGTDQSSELQTGRPPESERFDRITKKQESEWGLGASTEMPLKALNAPNISDSSQKKGRKQVGRGLAWGDSSCTRDADLLSRLYTLFPMPPASWSTSSAPKRGWRTEGLARRFPQNSIFWRVLESGTRKHVVVMLLRPFKTQTQNRSVLAPQFPKSHPSARW